MPKTTPQTNKKTRKLPLPTYRSFRLSKRIKPVDKAPLPSTRQLLAQTVRHIRAHKKVFLGIAVVYALLLIVFVRGAGGAIDVIVLKDVINEALGGTANSLTVNITLFGVLFSSLTTATSDIANMYQSIILLVITLATVWAFRQTTGEAKKKTTVRDTFYKSMGPLIPFLLVLLVIGLQLLPAIIASSVFSTVVANGLAVTGLEQLLWIVFLVLCILLSIYMVSSSMFALIIVTLPNMTPIIALRSARKLVLHRRWAIIRKLLLFLICLIIIFSAVLLGVIYTVPAIAEWAFFVESVIILPLGIGFIYKLYRALL